MQRQIIEEKAVCGIGSRATLPIPLVQLPQKLEVVNSLRLGDIQANLNGDITYDKHGNSS